MEVILETSRLFLRQFTTDDASFLLKLVNEPSWLRYIGDRHVHTVEDAEKYLLDGPIGSYAANGFGFYLVLLKSSQLPIGMCGFAKRPFLDYPDLGFAFLPEYTGQGYAFEIASSTLVYGHSELGLKKIVAITTGDNHRSIHLLSKLGFGFEKNIDAEGEKLHLYAVAL